jgi:hypothetical protein
MATQNGGNSNFPNRDNAGAPRVKDELEELSKSDLIAEVRALRARLHRQDASASDDRPRKKAKGHSDAPARPPSVSGANDKMLMFVLRMNVNQAVQEALKEPADLALYGVSNVGLACDARHL